MRGTTCSTPCTRRQAPRQQKQGVRPKTPCEKRAKIRPRARRLPLGPRAALCPRRPLAIGLPTRREGAAASGGVDAPYPFLHRTAALLGVQRDGAARPRSPLQPRKDQCCAARPVQINTGAGPRGGAWGGGVAGAGRCPSCTAHTQTHTHKGYSVPTRVPTG